MAKDVTFDQFSDFLAGRASMLNDSLALAMKRCGEKIKGDIKYDMAHTPLDMSRSYFTNNKTIAHHPSLPGNPPAPDTGNLRESINYEVHSEGKEVYGIVGSTQKDEDYAVYTEYGTTSGGWGGHGMAPRPWLRPAMRKNTEFIKRAIAQAVKDIFTGGTK